MAFLGICGRLVVHRPGSWEQATFLEACHLGSRCCLGKPPPVEGLDSCLAQNGLAQHVTEVTELCWLLPAEMWALRDPKADSFLAKKSFAQGGGPCVNPSQCTATPQPLAAQGVCGRGLLSCVMWACTHTQKEPAGELLMCPHQWSSFASEVERARIPGKSQAGFFPGTRCER